MIRLLKYDWKRNSTFLLSAFVLFILAELAVEIFVKNNEGAITLMILGYAAMAVIVVVYAVKTYVKNIVSSSRRMLPVSSLQHILSPLVMGLLGGLIIGLVLLLHFPLSPNFQDNPAFELVTALKPGKVVLLGLVGLETLMFQLLIFFLAYTIGRSLRIKFKAVVIIVAYLILQNGLVMIEDNLNLGGLDWGGATFAALDSGLIGGIIFELICSVIMVIVMVMLINKRVEVSK